MSGEISVRDVVVKAKKINGWRHLATYNQYVQKEGALVYQALTPDQLVKVNNAYQKTESDKHTRSKGGRSGIIAKNFIFSLPPVMEAIINRNNDKEMREMIDYVLNGFYEGVLKQHPKINIKWLKSHATIALHRDTEHTHFHLVVPCVVPDNSLFNPSLIRIDYGKRNISIKARRTLYNYCRGRLLSKSITEADFIEASKKETKSNASRNWAQKKQDMKASIIEAIQATEEANKRADRLASLYDENEKWINQITNDLQRLENRIERGEIGLKEVETEKERILKKVEKTKDEEVKKALKEETKKVIYKGPRM